MGMPRQHCRNRNVGQWQSDIGTKTTASQETGQSADAVEFLKVKQYCIIVIESYICHYRYLKCECSIFENDNFVLCSTDPT